jgi:hypothetical protein
MSLSRGHLGTGGAALHRAGRPLGSKPVGCVVAYADSGRNTPVEEIIL